MSSNNLKAKFITLGCKVNQYDTQNMRERLAEAGIREAGAGEKASLYVINTCTVTAKADRESVYQIHRAYRQNPAACIVVTGCLAERDRALIKKQPGVSLILGNRAKPGIAHRLKKSFAKLRIDPARAKEMISGFFGHSRAFVKVQDGCNNFCAYCKVPLVRGRSRSRPLKDIIAETRSLVDRGFKEIVLTGICLGAYGRDLRVQKDLVDVIQAIESIPGSFRIRLSSIEASDVSDRLIRCMGSSRKLCLHLHIPIQSGDDIILRRMRRSYSSKDYLGLIKRLKKRIPDIGITTDILVGFPGETQSQFENTVRLVKAINPLRTHIFPYSPRPGTAAAVYADKPIAHEELKRRIERMRSVSGRCSERLVRSFLSKQLCVLVEGRSSDNPCSWEGYTGNYIKARIVSKKVLANKLCFFRAQKSEGALLVGKDLISVRGSAKIMAPAKGFLNKENL